MGGLFGVDLGRLEVVVQNRRETATQKPHSEPPAFFFATLSLTPLLSFSHHSTTTLHRRPSPLPPVMPLASVLTNNHRTANQVVFLLRRSASSLSLAQFFLSPLLGLRYPRAPPTHRRGATLASPSVAGAPTPPPLSCSCGMKQRYVKTYLYPLYT